MTQGQRSALCLLKDSAPSVTADRLSQTSGLIECSLGTDGRQTRTRHTQAAAGRRLSLTIRVWSIPSPSQKVCGYT